jgi:hypothetical protein
VIRIAVCTNHLGTVEPDFTPAIMRIEHDIISWSSRIQAKAHADGIAPDEVANMGVQAVFVTTQDMLMGKAREDVVMQALGFSPDYIFCLDDDVSPPYGDPVAGTPGVVERLFGHKKDIVSGLYFMRKQPYTPQIYVAARDKGHDDKYWPVIKYPKGLIEVDAAGFGCMLIKADVFRAMLDRRNNYASAIEAAYASIDIEVRRYFRPLGPWFEFLCSQGEDMFFCLQARAMGYKIYCDTRIVCQHIGKAPIGEETFQMLLPVLEPKFLEARGDAGITEIKETVE